MSEAFEALVSARAAELEQKFYEWLADGALKGKWEKSTCPLPSILAPRCDSWGLRTDRDDDPLSVLFSADVAAFKKKLIASMPHTISLGGHAVWAARTQITTEALKYASEHTPQPRKVIRRG